MRKNLYRVYGYFWIENGLLYIPIDHLVAGIHTSFDNATSFNRDVVNKQRYVSILDGEVLSVYIVHNFCQESEE
jgi:hypothetical protein